MGDILGETRVGKEVLFIGEGIITFIVASADGLFAGYCSSA